MIEHSRRKLNQLQHLPDGALVDAAWLECHGYSSSLRSQYVKAGWLNQLAPRVYRRGDRPLRWQHVVISLQAFMGSELTVGGRTALEEFGYAHYLGQRREVHLYGPAKPPGWLTALPLDVKFHWHRSLRLFDPARLRPFDYPGLIDQFISSQAGIVDSFGSILLRAASTERAVFQLLDDLPANETFHQVDKLMEGLVNLSPRRLQFQLDTCRSVKVKRLFFFFADRHRHAWLGGINKSAVNLGTGKRMLVKGGKLDPTYLITVPGDLDGVS